MNEANRRKKTQIAVLFVFVALLAAIALPAMAQPDADSVAFLPFVTSPQVPTELYETEFEGSIEPWKMVRWQKNGS
jgi:hypothetical protein